MFTATLYCVTCSLVMAGLLLACLPPRPTGSQVAAMLAMMLFSPVLVPVVALAVFVILADR